MWWGLRVLPLARLGFQLTTDTFVLVSSNYFDYRREGGQTFPLAQQGYGNITLRRTPSNARGMGRAQSLCPSLRLYMIIFRLRELVF